MLGVARRRAYKPHPAAAVTGITLLQIAAAAFTTATSLSSQTATFSPTTAGSTLLCFGKLGGGGELTSISDTQGNTWTLVDYDHYQTLSGTAITAYICTNAKAMSSSDTITVGFSTSAQGNWAFAVVEVANLTSGIDQHATAGGNSETSQTVSTSSPTTALSEIAFTTAGIGNVPDAASTGAGWTLLSLNSSSAIQIAYQYLSTETTVSATWSLASAQNLIASIFTFK